MVQKGWKCVVADFSFRIVALDTSRPFMTFTMRFSCFRDLKAVPCSIFSRRLSAPARKRSHFNC